MLEIPTDFITSRMENVHAKTTGDFCCLARLYILQNDLSRVVKKKSSMCPYPRLVHLSDEVMM